MSAALFDRPDRLGLAANVAAAVGLATVCNALVYAFGWVRADMQPLPPLAPPGYVIGLVWTVLFALMGAARWLLLTRAAPARWRHARLVTALIVFCALYTFYGLAPESRIPGLIGNLVTIPLGAWVAWTIRATSSRAAQLVALVPLWVAYATIVFGPNMWAAG